VPPGPPTTVFVYGTLLRGGSGHHHLAGGRFLGPARTEPAWTLIDLGAYPALRPGGSSPIPGELYAVDDALLAALDRWEEVPTLYRRTAVALEGGGEAQAWVMDDAEGPAIPRWLRA
jgi:gamma-glutamylaminecyclotransferase